MNPSQIFADIVRVIARYEADFPSRISGSASADIQRVEALSGTSVPEVYHAFLTLMGNDAAGLTPLSANFSLNAVISSLSRYKPPAEFCLIGLQDDHPNLDVFLERDSTEVAPGMGPRVVRFEASDPVEQVFSAYPSLPDMVLSAAFARYRLQKMPFRERLTPKGATWPKERRAERPSVLAGVASRLSFERLLHSSLASACYDKPNASMLLYAPHDLNFSVDIGATTEKVLDTTVEAVSDALSLGRSTV